VARYLAISGTWAYDTELGADEWWNPQSAWCRYLAQHGMTYLEPDEPYCWDGHIDGIRGKKVVWTAAASQLAYRLRRVPLEDRNLVAHSHGGQVALLTAAVLPINRLVTVATPVRKDMRDTALHAQIRGGWRHLYSVGWSDYMQLLGSLFDGAWSLERRFLVPTCQNVGIPGGVGHSRLLNDPALFDWWVKSGTLAFLAGPWAERRAVDPRASAIPAG
jgi:pimeloyl-ACP methyl ester carboxylesterase